MPGGFWTQGNQKQDYYETSFRMQPPRKREGGKFYHRNEQPGTAAKPLDRCRNYNLETGTTRNMVIIPLTINRRRLDGGNVQTDFSALALFFFLKKRAYLSTLRFQVSSSFQAQSIPRAVSVEYVLAASGERRCVNPSGTFGGGWGGE